MPLANFKKVERYRTSKEARYYVVPVSQGMGNWDFTERAMAHFSALTYVDQNIRKELMPDGEEKLMLRPDPDSPTGTTYRVVDVRPGAGGFPTRNEILRGLADGENESSDLRTGEGGVVMELEEMWYGHRVIREDADRWRAPSPPETDPHRFEADQRVAQILEMTENEFRPIRLPFPSTFFDVRLLEKRKTYYGILADELTTEFQEGFPLILVNALYWHDEALVGHLHFTLPMHPKVWNEASYGYKQSVRAVTRWLMNFVYLLDHPNVKHVKVARKSKADARRQAAGKKPMPATTRIRLRGELRLYADKLLTGRRQTYTHSFWVRGHWRHLTAANWTTMRGHRLWIAPYVKGEDILVKKDYDYDPAWLKRKGSRRRGPPAPRPPEEALR